MCCGVFQIGVSQEMQYDDAFTLQKVEDEYVDIFNYMAGMVPLIQKLIRDVSSDTCYMYMCTSLKE